MDFSAKVRNTPTLWESEYDEIVEFCLKYGQDDRKMKIGFNHGILPCFGRWVFGSIFVHFLFEVTIYMFCFPFKCTLSAKRWNTLSSPVPHVSKYHIIKFKFRHFKSKTPDFSSFSNGRCRQIPSVVYYVETEKHDIEVSQNFFLHLSQITDFQSTCGQPSFVRWTQDR